MSQEVLLSVKDLRTEFFSSKTSSVTAIKDVSFDMYRGEVLGLVGESGCGKSVTSLSIMQLLKDTPGKVTNGSATLDGVNLVEASDAQIRDIRGGKMSMIFQEPMSSLNPVYRIGDQMLEMIRTHNKQISKKDALDQCVEMLKRVGIPSPEQRIKEFPHQLSGGMRQRVMIAMALLCNPKLLIADEPTTALDVTIQAQILDLMKDLQKKTGMGIIFITHNLGVVADICDKVSVMYAGKIVEQGPVDDIFYEPAHPYTKGLLRSMPRVDAESYERLIPIEGTPVDMLNPPEGCPFAPRCEHCMKICLKKMPPYVEVGEKHRSACWLRVQELMNKEEK